MVTAWAIKYIQNIAVFTKHIKLLLISTVWIRLNPNFCGRRSSYFLKTFQKRPFQATRLEPIIRFTFLQFFSLFHTPLKQFLNHFEPIINKIQQTSSRISDMFPISTAHLEFLNPLEGPVGQIDMVLQKVRSSLWLHLQLIRRDAEPSFLKCPFGIAMNGGFLLWMLQIVACQSKLWSAWGDLSKLRMVEYSLYN